MTTPDDTEAVTGGEEQAESVTPYTTVPDPEASIGDTRTKRPSQARRQQKKPQPRVTLRTRWPLNEFRGDDFPTVTPEGTTMTKSEADRARSAAERSGTTLLEA